MSDRREAVRANARYLRQVRPIDPDEISEYVAGQPHPAVVRQLLREEASDLGLIERDDGTFVPVPDEPVPPRREPVGELPERYDRRLDDWLADRYGPNWHEGASGDLLRSTLRRTKAQYLEGGSVTYDEEVSAAYAIYHLPGYYAAVQYALEDLSEAGLLERHLRVLDVGAGVGGPALGLCDYLPDDALLEYHAVEPSAAADVLESMLDETGPNVHASIHRTTAEEFDPDAGTDDGAYDLVLLCNVLSELDDPVAVCRKYLDVLAADGSLLAMAPADRETAIGLREVERAVEADGAGDRNGDGEASNASDGADGRSTTVYGPMVRLWPGERPSDRGWSFDVRPDLAVPSVQSRLDEAAADPEHSPGEFTNVDVQFAYSILRVDGRRRHDVALDTARWAKMAEMERHVPSRIDLVAAKVSRSLSGGDEGARAGTVERANPLFKISDGSERVDHYAVVTRETALNRPLLEAEYGDLLAVESALALWNDDEEAYNLVVDEETVVDPLG